MLQNSQYDSQIFVRKFMRTFKALLFQVIYSRLPLVISKFVDVWNVFFLNVVQKIHIALSVDSKFYQTTISIFSCLDLSVFVKMIIQITLIKQKMLFQCQKNYVESWIKLQQVSEQTRPSLERLKRSLQLNGDEDNQKSRKMNQNPESSSSYISSIFSLQKGSKNAQKDQGRRNRRLLYHNYIKYKTIPFNYHQIFMPKQYSSNLVNELTNKIYQTTVQKSQNFCFLGFGSQESELQSLFEGTQNSNEGLLYLSVIKLNQMILRAKSSSHISKKLRIKLNLNFLAVTEHKIFDLMDLNNQIFLKQDDNRPNQVFLKPLIFQGATQYKFSSNYQLYTTFKRMFMKRRSLNAWNVLIVKINLQIQNLQTEETSHKTALIIQWVKDNVNSSLLSQNNSHRNRSPHGQKPLLCLNQCILQIFKLIELRMHINYDQKNQASAKLGNQYSENQVNRFSCLQSFRNSLITRILKPYLLFDSQMVFMSCLSINQEQQNDSYQSLMLGKHISRIYSLIKNKQLENTSHYTKQNDTLSEEQLQGISETSMQLQAKKSGQNQNLKMQDRKVYPQSTTRARAQKNANKNTNLSDPQIFQKKTASKKQQQIRQKLLDLLEQSKQKQRIRNADNYGFSSMSKKIFEEKTKSLKVKKQLNMLKIKAKTKNLRNQLTSNHESEVDDIEQQIKRLDFDERKIQKQIQDLNKQVRNKFLISKNTQFEGQSPVQKDKNKIQRLRILKSHLKNQIQMTEIEINSFLQERQSIKSIYANQIQLVAKKENELLKKLTNSKQYRKPNQNMSDQKPKNTMPRMRMIREMQPFQRNLLRQGNLNVSLDNHNYGRKMTLPSKKEERYQRSERERCNEHQNSKKFTNNTKKQRFQTIDLGKLRVSRELVRKREKLNEKIDKGKAAYANFLQDTVKKYQQFSPNQQKLSKK